MSSNKNSGGHAHNRLAGSGTFESSARQVHPPPNKKPTTSREAKKNKSHKEATFDYYQRDRVDEDDDDDDDDDDEKQRSRSSSSTNCSTTDSSSSSHSRLASGNTPSSASTEHPRQSASLSHGKSIYHQVFDSHGSSTATKYSSDNGGSIPMGSDSDDEHHLQSPPTRKNLLSSTKNSPLANPLSSKSHMLHNDTTPTVVVSCPHARNVSTSLTLPS